MKLFLFLVSILSSASLLSQPEAGMPSVPGKCFAKSLFPEQIKYAKDTILHYSNIYTLEHTEEKIILQGESHKWVKKKKDKNCISTDPNDCLVWCSELIPEKYIIKRTPVNLEKATLEYKEPIEYEVFRIPSHTDWTEIICEEDVSSELIIQIKKALISRNYFDNDLEFSEKIEAPFKATLSRFQKDNGLPVGQLDIKTLEALEIDY